MIQVLVEHGHPWLSVQQYTLSEVGAFYRAVIERERVQRSELISSIWMGTHCEDQKELEKVLHEINPNLKYVKEKSVTQEEVNNDWKRLASLRLT